MPTSTTMPNAAPGRDHVIRVAELMAALSVATGLGSAAAPSVE